MPSVIEVRDAIVATLKSVEKVGQVHAYERYAATNEKLRKFYEYSCAGDTHLRGWYVRRLTTQEFDGTVNPQQIGWVIRGFMALSDANESELIFDDVIERIRDAFRDDYDLGGLIDSSVNNDLAGVQLEDANAVMFAGVLCHSARLKLWTQCTVTISDNLALNDFITYHADTDMAPADGQIDATDEVTLEQ